MSKPLVSIIIPTFNRRKMLDEAIKSVMTQTIANWELIVVDDASIDETGRVVEYWMENDQRVCYEKNNVSIGGSGARNIGIRKAKGEFIAFLDDDDMWLPTKLEKQLDLFKKKPESVAASCWFTVNYFFGMRVIKTVDNPTLQQILSDNVLGTASVCMARKSVVKKVNGFSENLPSAQDWDFWVKLRRHGPVATVGESLVIYSVHQQQKISTNLTKKYIGTRRFFLNYRSLMENETRRNVLAFIAFICSRKTVNFKNKFKWLLRSLKWGRGFAKKSIYIFSVLKHFLAAQYKNL